jgi:hypothetical protein
MDASLNKSRRNPRLKLEKEFDWRKKKTKEEERTRNITWN